MRGYGYFTTSGTTFTPAIALTLNTPILVTFYYSSVDGKMYLQINNGTPESVTLAGTGRPLAALTGVLLMGKSFNQPLQMVHYELDMIDVKLGDTERAAINAALISKWGL